MRIASDIHGLERVAPSDVTVVCCSAASFPSRWKRNVALLRAALRSDQLIIHFLLPEVIFFAVCLYVIPFHRCRIATLDLFIGEPKPWIIPLIRWSLKQVGMLLVYFRDGRVFEQKFGLEDLNFVYVPFKINAVELIRDTPSSDAGYIFTGGRSRRDFATFFAAVEPLGYPVKLLTGDEADLSANGSTLRGLRVPANVEVVKNDVSVGLFVRSMAAARLVVLPLVRDSTTQAGIAVYLQAMALRKCVIISAGLGVSDVLTGGEAMIVPAGDPGALRGAIEVAWNDPAVREHYAEAGYRHALPLGGEDELRRSVLKAIGVEPARAGSTAGGRTGLSLHPADPPTPR
jgi:glycosyltransferase involved in cell wall biosynthesis